MNENDRRFHSEKVNHARMHDGAGGILPAGETAHCDEGLQKTLPLGYYDAGNGMYDEFTNTVVPVTANSYASNNLTREASQDEARWIKAKAAKGMPQKFHE